MKTTENIERFRRAVENNKFTMFEELQMTAILLEKYNFISLGQYAKKEGVSPQGAMARLKAKNDPYIPVMGKIMIVP
jgi:hypothetical protein